MSRERCVWVVEIKLARGLVWRVHVPCATAEYAQLVIDNNLGANLDTQFRVVKYTPATRRATKGD